MANHPIILPAQGCDPGGTWSGWLAKPPYLKYASNPSIFRTQTVKLGIPRYKEGGKRSPSKVIKSSRVPRQRGEAPPGVRRQNTNVLQARNSCARRYYDISLPQTLCLSLCVARSQTVYTPTRRKRYIVRRSHASARLCRTQRYESTLPPTEDRAWPYRNLPYRITFRFPLRARHLRQKAISYTVLEWQGRYSFHGSRTPLTMSAGDFLKASCKKFAMTCRATLLLKRLTEMMQK